MFKDKNKVEEPKEELPKQQITIQEVIDAIDGHLQRAKDLLTLIK
jgi:hypothetical protein